MTIDPKTLPKDTVVQIRRGRDGVVTLGVAAGDGCIAAGPDAYAHATDGQIVAVFVPVPDGVAYDDALRAVNDTRPWVEVEWEGIPEGARWRFVQEGVMGSGDSDWKERYEVHPDDVPDPDADLIERTAAAFLEGDPAGNMEWGQLSEKTRERFRTAARAALAVIREDQP